MRICINRTGSCTAALLLAMLSIAGLSAFAQAAAAPGAPGRVNHPYALHVADAARRFGIPEAWIWAVMRVESNGDSRAVSTAGAIGLMQVMPATWVALRARHGLGAALYDARDNIMAGAAYLRAMYDRYGNTTAMLAAYNAGPGRYDDYLSRGRPLPAETHAYVARLASITGGARDIGRVATPTPDLFTWRRAALFVRVASAADVVAPVQSGGGITARVSSDDTPSERSAVVSLAGVKPRPSAPADTLFVPRVGAGRPQ